MNYRIRQDFDTKLHGEIGTISQLRHDKTTIVLTYPNTYAVGMSNLGFQTIYGLLNECDNVCCERAFLPDAPLLPLYRQTHAPLCSLESKTSFTDADIVAFSISFENDYLHLLDILELAHIPLKAEDRNDYHPLIIAGGAITTINPEPLALFVDAFILGDGEEIVPQFVDTYQQYAPTCPKQALLKHLAAIPGVYVPSLYDVTYRENGAIAAITPIGEAPPLLATCPLADLDAFPAYSRILTEQTEFGDMFLIQLTRGCPYQCRFCHTGYTQRPLRHLSFETATRLIEHGLQFRKKIGLVSPAVADYPHFEALYDFILERGGSVTVSSLRISACANTDILERLSRAGQRTITLAPEAGTERLRKIIRKNLSNELFYATIERIALAGIPNIKLYFLIGIPSETDDDIEALINVCRQCRDIMVQTMKSSGRVGTITISVNPCIPKPSTPLQWCGMATERELKQKLQRITRAFARIGNVELIAESPRMAVWQGILARGDRKIGDVLLQTKSYQGDWKKAFRQLQLSPEFYSYRERDAEEQFPWQHLQVGQSQQQLFEEYQQLFTGVGRGTAFPSLC